MFVRSFVVYTLLFVLVLSHHAMSEHINIGILARHKMTQFSFKPQKGKYALYADNQKIGIVDSGQSIVLTARKNKVQVNYKGKFRGSFNNVNIIGIAYKNYFAVSPLIPKRQTREYDDNLKVSVYGGVLRLINNIELDNYIAGVVQAEVGPNPAPEFFKLQAILCRTYALSKLDKHQFEGYNLCDRVHCQAYHRRCTKLEIERASKATKGNVIVDSDINLITAAFYSNCGGQTVNSEDVWQKPLYYLRSVKDPHCTREPNAKWQKKISKTEWVNYLEKKTGYLQTAGINSSNLENFNQPARKKYYIYKNQKIPLRTIRTDWKLKSTYFDAILNGDYVYLYGKGFGHGSGLCQEGAMKMASSGYSYTEILHFYYKDVHLIDLSVIDFFRGD